MTVRHFAIGLITAVSQNLWAQQDAEAQQEAAKSKPEEIVITGAQHLRQQMMVAEAKAYDVFNQFNDEKRFQISCSISRPTGTNFEKQTCSPEFEIRATRAHAQDLATSFQMLYVPGGLPDGSVSANNLPAEARIGVQLPEYRQKLKQVAEQHPEFLEAIKEYVRLREQYEGRVAAESGRK